METNDTNATTVAQTGTEGANEPTGAVTKSLDDLLNEDKSLQADFDKRVAKAIETRTNKLKEEFDNELNEKLEEQKRLASLDDEARAKELQEAKLKEFEQREAQLKRKELEADVKELLSEANLSKDLLGFVVAEDVESSKQRIETLNTLINEQVEKGVQGKITQSGVPAQSKGKALDDEIANAFIKKY